MLVEHINAIDAVNMDVNEPGHDGAGRGEGVRWTAMDAACRVGSDIENAGPVDDDGPGRDHPVGQDEIGVRQAIMARERES